MAPTQNPRTETFAPKGLRSIHHPSPGTIPRTHNSFGRIYKNSGFGFGVWKSQIVFPGIFLSGNSKGFHESHPPRYAHRVPSLRLRYLNVAAIRKSRGILPAQLVPRVYAEGMRITGTIRRAP